MEPYGITRDLVRERLAEYATFNRLLREDRLWDSTEANRLGAVAGDEYEHALELLDDLLGACDGLLEAFPPDVVALGSPLLRATVGRVRAVLDRVPR